MNHQHFMLDSFISTIVEGSKVVSGVTDRTLSIVQVVIIVIGNLQSVSVVNVHDIQIQYDKKN